jgi:hypothetical protein
MLPIVGVEGRTVGQALAVAALGFGVLVLPSLRVREVRPSAIRAPWVTACAARMQEARSQMTLAAPELARAEVSERWSLSEASAQLALAPQYSAAIVYRPGDECPSVFDWEEMATPVAGSFALHRHVGHFDLSIIADDSDERGLMFAARMQPLLDECLMEAK